MVRAVVDFLRGACFFDLEEADFDVDLPLLVFFVLGELVLFLEGPALDELCPGATLACNNSPDKRVAVKRAANIV